MLALTSLFTLLLTLMAPGPSLPKAAMVMLDSRFPGWHLNIADSSRLPRIEGTPFARCNLNNDNKTDFALDILVPRNEKTCEYFVALVSSHLGFSLYILDSLSGLEVGQFYLSIIQKGTDLEIFGDDSLQTSEGATAGPIHLKADCPTVIMVDKNACTSYLFDHDRFIAFASCD